MHTQRKNSHRTVSQETGEILPVLKTIPDTCWQENRRQPGQKESLADAASPGQTFAHGSVIATRIAMFFPIIAMCPPVKAAPSAQEEQSESIFVHRNRCQCAKSGTVLACLPGKTFRNAESSSPASHYSGAGKRALTK